MKKIDDYEYGQTPLPASWKKDLRLPINTSAELNEAEAANVQQAIEKYFFSRRKKWPITDFQFLKTLHRDMFGDVWKWGGEFRLATQETNIGVEAGKISTALAEACKNCEAWIEHGSIEPTELAVRYHHKVVQVHPFPNGNGRFSRILANLVMQQYGLKPLAWGGEDIGADGPVRKAYVDALRAADGNDYGPLIKFAQENFKANRGERN